MHLECKVLIQNGICSLNKSARPAKGVVGLACKKGSGGRTADGSRFLLIRTKCKNQPECIELQRFRSMITIMANQGKATIQFADPDLNVFISEANPEKLRKFLSLIGSAAKTDKGELLSIELQSIENFDASTSKVISKTNLQVHSRSEYPGKNGFPSGLVELIVQGINLRSVDLRWFNLKLLRHLDLSHNGLGITNRTTAHWQKFYSIERLSNLEILNLGHNGFEGFPDMFYDALPTSLKVLNLNSNRIRKLSERISRLKSLSSLIIHSNHMELLPEDLFIMSKLRFIDASNNNLRHLHGIIFCHRRFNKYDTLDFSENNFQRFVPNIHQERTPSTLCQIAAASVLNNRKLSPDGSTLSKNIEEFLPRFVTSTIRQDLTRCTHCYRLFPIDLESESIRAVYLSLYTIQIIGPTIVNVASAMCYKCRPICRSRGVIF